MYQTNEHGIITSPGKFEGQMYYVPQLWDMVLEGFSDLTWYDDLSRCLDFFIIDSDLINDYPELQGYQFLSLFEDDQGFVYCDLFESVDEIDVDGDLYIDDLIEDITRMLNSLRES